MTETVIKLEDIGKQYRLGQIGTGTLSHDFNRWWHKIRGKDDPYLRIGEVNIHEKKGESAYVWALKNINFEVKRGESLAIIGKNGAGKSTLLKILSRVTGPTTGSFKVKGRIASLLEVGTGFHQELTGRENIYMNGAILGMTRHEIKNKFDEIVAFSGIERYIDTPAKRYSSGMFVRLAFAVAAHLDSEILIADEVLAVGDAEFQKKCLGKMKDVTTQGRTVLFVSHSMPAVRSFCKTAVLLKNGNISMTGNVDDVITKYMSTDEGSDENHRLFNPAISVNSNIKLHSFSVNKPGEEAGESIPIDMPIEVSTEIEVVNIEANNRYDITMQVKDDEGRILFTTSSGWHDEQVIVKGRQVITCHIPANFFNTGTFYINLLIVENRRTIIFIEQDITKILMIDSQLSLGKWMSRTSGFLKPLFKWSSEINNPEIRA
jgi:lipopolysaccharide transport system ATP-binding protein